MEYNINEEIKREDIFIGYRNGAEAYLKGGKLDAIRYNTGDWVWFSEGGEVEKILTHDGIDKEYKNGLFYNIRQGGKE